MTGYLAVAEARELEGLRLVLSRGVPAPWGLAAKTLFTLKGIPFTLVAHDTGSANEELQQWTGQRSAPVAIYDNERPRSGWAEILLLAERLAPQPRLIPSAESDRVTMFGLAHEICGEDGLGWNRRLMMLCDLQSAAAANPSQPPMPPEMLSRLVGKFADRDCKREAALERSIAILQLLTRRLEAQQRAGRRYFIGDRISAADIYWAAFSNLVAPLPPESCPMPPSVRALYCIDDEDLNRAISPILIDHRTRVLEDCFQMPMDF